MPNAKDDADLMIERVLSRYVNKQATEKSGMARATIVVDENVNFLAKALGDANFRVISPPKGMSDFEIKKNLLSHRIIVTKNTKDFLAEAPVLDYGIIGLEAIPFVDTAAEYKDNQTAQMISKAVSEHDLISERKGFVLMLHPNGRHVFRRLG